MKSLPHHILAVFSTAQFADGAITVSSPSLVWSPLNGNFDYLDDQQTGQPGSDIVGQGNNYGMLIGFNDNGTTSRTDGDLLFRVRLDDGPVFNDVLWIGIDANSSGSLDAFLALNTKTNPDEIAIFLPGSGTNTSPSTTTIGSKTFIAATTASNYNIRLVDYTTDGGDTNDLTPGTSKTPDPDYYLSFMVPFQSVVNFLGTARPGIPAIAITDQSLMRFISATSTNANALNQDLGGVNQTDPNYNPAATWLQMGALSGATSVPEPSSALLTLGSLAAALLIHRRRQ